MRLDREDCRDTKFTGEIHRNIQDGNLESQGKNWRNKMV